MKKVISNTNIETGKKENIIVDYLFPKDLEFFDFCKFMQDADLKIHTDRHQVELNAGNMMYMKTLNEFTNLKKLSLSRSSSASLNSSRSRKASARKKICFSLSFGSAASFALMQASLSATISPPSLLKNLIALSLKQEPIKSTVVEP
jgi:hypothetical protein